MKDILRLWQFYYKFAGNKLYLLFSLSVLAVLFQGLGISLFLPILQGENSSGKISNSVKKVFDFFAIEYTLLYLLIFLVIFFFLRSLFLVGQATLTGKIMAELLVKSRSKITEKIFQLDYQSFLDKSSGYLNNALVVECEKAVFSFKLFSNLLVTIIFAVMYIGIPLFLNPALILTLSVIGIPLFFLIKKINVLTKDYSVKTSAHSAGLQKILIQSLNYFKYLKATLQYPNLLKQISFQSKLLGKLQYRLNTLGAISQHGFEPFVVFILACVIFYYVGLQGQDIIENFFLLYLLYNAMGQMLGTQINLRKLLNSWGSIKVLKDLESQLEKSKELIPEKKLFRNISFDQSIRFENVCFSFSNGVQVLKNINMEIQPNSTVAFVGNSGVGKTTLVNMFVGILRPTEGAIYLGETPYIDIAPDEIRKKLGYITQENVIFNDTIYNNITLWDFNGSDKENMSVVSSALEKAHIAEFINGLANGVDSMLGEGGINISGGQRQRICIARELYKNPEILIFDEATSSLDTETEKEIQKNIDEFKGKKTIVLVAHRLSTVKYSDKIFVLKNGSIVEQGSYESLCNLNGEFKKMVDHQNSSNHY